jgi:HPt (histidine-containing phosphotransfer) domain-containing protein
MPTEPPEPLIDWNQLDLISGECGPEIGDIFRDFIADFALQSGRLRALREQNDPAGIGKAAHQLKGSSSTFGMRHFAALAKGIERATAELGTLPSAEELAELERAFTDSIAQIRRERPVFQEA